MDNERLLKSISEDVADIRSRDASSDVAEIRLGMIAVAADLKALAERARSEAIENVPARISIDGDLKEIRNTLWCINRLLHIVAFAASVWLVEQVYHLFKG